MLAYRHVVPMILAPDNRFIFIHVPKSAGTSINGALSIHDVFFSVRGRSRAARARRAENSGLPEAAANLGEHSSAKQFIRALGRDVYDGYYSFGFVRNPWDVAVSWFHYRLITSSVSGYDEAQAAGTFEAYVHRYLAGEYGARRAGLQHPFLIDEKGELAVTFVGRYESLEQDFKAVKSKLGIETLPLDHFNQIYHAPWAKLYTPATFAVVGDLVRADAELFGYADDPAAYGIV